MSFFDVLSDKIASLHKGDVNLADFDFVNGDIKIRGNLKIGNTTLSSKVIDGIGEGYKIARGVAAVTGTATVATGLTTVVVVTATAQSDLDGDALAGVSATVGNQTNAPVAGSIILKAWKNNADGDATMVAANAAQNINWIAIGV